MTSAALAEPAITAGNGTSGKRRDITDGVYGVRRDLPGGGWIRIVPRVGNVALMRRRDQLHAELRAQLGIDLVEPAPPQEEGAEPEEAAAVEPKEKSLPLPDLLELTVRIMLGPVITGWGDFDFDGELLLAPPAKHPPDQPFAPDVEAAGLRLLSIQEIAVEVNDELDALDALHSRAVKAAEGNSPQPSAGT